MSMKVLERLSGRGNLYEGEESLGAVRYSVTIYQKTTRLRTMDSDREVPTMQAIRGRIDGADCFDLLNRGVKVTLEVEDGRRWNFYVQDSNGTLAHAGA